MTAARQTIEGKDIWNGSGLSYDWDTSIRKRHVGMCHTGGRETYGMYLACIVIAAAVKVSESVEKREGA